MLETVNVVWSDYQQVWAFVAQLGVLLLALLGANTLRIRVPFLRRMLFPSALIAGLLIFALKSILAVCNVDYSPIFDNATMQIITYHTLGLGFAAVTLKRATQKKDKKQTVKIFDYALINSGTYMLQAVLIYAIKTMHKRKGSPLWQMMHSWIALSFLLPQNRASHL